LDYEMSDPLTDADEESSTPLTPDELAALIPSYVTLRSELNEIEQIGIDRADDWASRADAAMYSPKIFYVPCTSACLVACGPGRVSFPEKPAAKSASTRGR
jgi:hypothetical protein